MKDHRLYKKYRDRLVRESILKSLFWGVIFGSAALCVTALLSWFLGFKNGIWIALGLFFALTAGVTPLFYFLRYRPTVKQVARRVDALGLEERMLTMTELEGDDSFIAKIQREDTYRALGSVNHMMLKIALSLALVLPFAAALLLGAGMTTVSALYYTGVIPSFNEAVTEQYVPREFTVSYGVDENGLGTIIWRGGENWHGDWENTVTVEGTFTKKEGEDMDPVYAIPDDGWCFVSWSDGLNNPYRHDTDLDGDVIVYAIFEPIEEDPTAPQQQQQQQQQQNPQDSDNSPPDDSSDSEQQQEPEGEPGEDPSAGGMRDTSSQQIQDGKTYYGDEFDQGRQDAMDRLEGDKNMPDEYKDDLQDYYDSIETSGSDNGD